MIILELRGLGLRAVEEHLEVLHGGRGVDGQRHGVTDYNCVTLLS